MNTPQSPDLDDPLASLMRGFYFIASALQPQAGAAGLPLSMPQSMPLPGPSPVNTVLLQAQAAAGAAVMRGMQRGAQSWADYGRALAPRPAGVAAFDDAQQLARHVDEARAHLRRLAEIAADEARLLETQLRGLDEQLCATVAGPAPADPPARRRYARAKR